MKAGDAHSWVVIPAAGSGTRMGGDQPKQYLTLDGKTVIEHVLERFDRPGIHGIVIAVAENDPMRERLTRKGERPIMTVTGGAERHLSVLNALHFLKNKAAGDDWVLVHDAARPCVRDADIDRLLELQHHPVGGLLGLPVTDTLKRVDGLGDVAATVNRKGIWRALTPQMFRLDELLYAIERAVREDALITDEAGAIERTARSPRIIAGSPDNIKITRPEDLVLAEMILRQQGREAR